MKHLYIILLCVLGITSCLGTHYFEPEVGEAFKAFKYVVEIEGVESQEPTIVAKGDELAELTGKLKLEFPEFYEKWYVEHGGYPNYSRAIIAFDVPANMTEAERKVEVKVSIANDFRDTENWGEWETVFSAVQEGC